METTRSYESTFIRMPKIKLMTTPNASKVTEKLGYSILVGV